MNLFEKLYTPKGVAMVLALGVAVNILLFLLMYLGAGLLGDRSPTQDIGGGQAPAEPVPSAGAAQYASSDGSLREVALAQEAQYSEGKLYTPKKGAEGPPTKKAEGRGEGFREETGGPQRRAPTTNAPEPLARSGGPALALPAAALLLGSAILTYAIVRRP